MKTRLAGGGGGGEEEGVSLGVPVIIGAFEGGPVAISVANFSGHITDAAPVAALRDRWGGGPAKTDPLRSPARVLPKSNPPGTVTDIGTVKNSFFLCRYKMN